MSQIDKSKADGSESEKISPMNVDGTHAQSGMVTDAIITAVVAATDDMISDELVETVVDTAEEIISNGICGRKCIIQ